MSSDSVDHNRCRSIRTLVLDGVRKGSGHESTAQNTTLSWILSGPEAPQSPEKHQCEEHFKATHFRTPEGRYIARRPFKNGPSISIGESRSTAVSSFRRLEQRLIRDPINASEYREFLADYETSGHIIKSPQTKISRQNQSKTITFRIMLSYVIAVQPPAYEWSSMLHAAPNGISLNDHMLIAPKLQKDLATVIMQWRQYRYVFTTDIAKMYRQILVNSRDTSAHCMAI
ncbi:PREDICTED: uncharacterized protein LOC108746285 [Trachymyrmex septentrionalis]|uniref:uncharacterized protein LOC108746285 n=1 Tax=Trachymyrmex septentrionalis TaxID=34720 RepID=UPI00084F58A2|nr:PREDICTED: uncharacterized protein LOC108746285 [Trachymyrmex septentrionalis]